MGTGKATANPKTIDPYMRAYFDRKAFIEAVRLNDPFAVELLDNLLKRLQDPTDNSCQDTQGIFDSDWKQVVESIHPRDKIQKTKWLNFIVARAHSIFVVSLSCALLPRGWEGGMYRHSVYTNSVETIFSSNARARVRALSIYTKLVETITKS